MGIEKDRNTRHILWKFLLSYLIIFVIPLFAGSFVYNILVDTVEEDARNLNSSILE